LVLTVRDGNGDTRVLVEHQDREHDQRTQMKAVTGRAEQFAAGYATLDQADNGRYASKERRGLSRDANYNTRY
jgi:hypothetical protein